MLRLCLAVGLLGSALARPELYKEKEDFQYSRSSTDEGSKSGFYGAQRGNMGGNYEKAHNMDGTAQVQMSDIIQKVDNTFDMKKAELNPQGEVFGAAHSSAAYGGNFDGSTLAGRNFEEGSRLNNFNNYQSSSRYSSASKYGGASKAGLTQSVYDGHNGYNGNHGYGSALYDASQSRGYDSQHSQSYAQEEYNRNYEAARAQNTKVIPIKIVLRPAQTATVPVSAHVVEGSGYTGSQAYNHEQTSLSQGYGVQQASAHTYEDQNNAALEQLQNGKIFGSVRDVPYTNGANDNRLGTGNVKHQESSYSYNKAWERRSEVTDENSIASPTPNPLSILVDSELAGTEALTNQQSSYLREGQTSNTQHELAGSTVTDNRQSGYAGANTGRNYESSSSYGNQKQWERHGGNTPQVTVMQPVGYYGGESERLSQGSLGANQFLSSNSASRAYGTKTATAYNDNRLRTNFGTNNNLQYSNAARLTDVDSTPKTSQSSYSYHKSWERQGDPYVIKPAVPPSSTYLRQPSAAYVKREDCDEEQRHTRGIRSYNSNQYYNHHPYPSAEDLPELGQEVQQESLDLTQQPQTNWQEQEVVDYTRHPGEHSMHLRPKSNWPHTPLSEYPNPHWHAPMHEHGPPMPWQNAHPLPPLFQPKFPGEQFSEMNHPSLIGHHHYHHHTSQQNQQSEFQDYSRDWQPLHPNIQDTRPPFRHDQEVQNQWHHIQESRQSSTSQNERHRIVSMDYPSSVTGAGHDQSIPSNTEGQQVQNQWDQIEDSSLYKEPMDVTVLNTQDRQVQNQWNKEDSNFNKDEGQMTVGQNVNFMTNTDQQVENQWQQTEDSKSNKEQMDLTGLNNQDQQVQNQWGKEDLNTSTEEGQMTVGQNVNFMANTDQQIQNQWDQIEDSKLNKKEVQISVDQHVDTAFSKNEGQNTQWSQSEGSQRNENFGSQTFEVIGQNENQNPAQNNNNLNKELAEGNSKPNSNQPRRGDIDSGSYWEDFSKTTTEAAVFPENIDNYFNSIMSTLNNEKKKDEKVFTNQDQIYQNTPKVKTPEEIETLSLTKPTEATTHEITQPNLTETDQKFRDLDKKTNQQTQISYEGQNFDQKTQDLGQETVPFFTSEKEFEIANQHSFGSNYGSHFDQQSDDFGPATVPSQQFESGSHTSSKFDQQLEDIGQETEPFNPIDLTQKTEPIPFPQGESIRRPVNADQHSFGDNYGSYFEQSTKDVNQETVPFQVSQYGKPLEAANQHSFGNKYDQQSEDLGQETVPFSTTSKSQPTRRLQNTDNYFSSHYGSNFEQQSEDLGQETIPFSQVSQTQETGQQLESANHVSSSGLDQQFENLGQETVSYSNFNSNFEPQSEDLGQESVPFNQVSQTEEMGQQLESENHSLSSSFDQQSEDIGQEPVPLNQISQVTDPKNLQPFDTKERSFSGVSQDNTKEQIQKNSNVENQKEENYGQEPASYDEFILALQRGNQNLQQQMVGDFQDEQLTQNTQELGQQLQDIIQEPSVDQRINNPTDHLDKKEIQEQISKKASSSLAQEPSDPNKDVELLVAPIESSSETPGFWKKVGTKFVSAKDTVSSWFSKKS